MHRSCEELLSPQLRRRRQPILLEKYEQFNPITAIMGVPANPVFSSCGHTKYPEASSGSLVSRESSLILALEEPLLGGEVEEIGFSHNAHHTLSSYCSRWLFEAYKTHMVLN